MNQYEFDNLSAGDIIRHVDGSSGYIVHGNYLRGGVLIARSLVAHNPAEWHLVGKAQYTEGERMTQQEDVQVTVSLPFHVYQRIQAEVARSTDGTLTPDQWIAAVVREQFSYSENAGDDE